MDPELLVEKVPDWRGRHPVVTPIEGGITNRNFRVDVEGESFVLRALSRTTDDLGIDRDTECACTRRAWELGIGPEVVHFSLDDGILVTRFVDARTVSPEDARRPEVMRRIVATIKRFHEGPEIPGRFSPFDTVRDYHRKAVGKGVDLPGTAPEATAIMDRLESALRATRTTAPCHNDLLAANFLDDGDRIWIIDWEYGGMGDPVFDLGNFSVNQELDAAEREFLLRSYFGSVTPTHRAHLRLMELASDLRESFWGFLQSGISDLDFDYVAYGRTHLERFLQRATAPELGVWIDDVTGE